MAKRDKEGYKRWRCLVGCNGWGMWRGEEARCNWVWRVMETTSTWVRVRPVYFNKAFNELRSDVQRLKVEVVNQAEQLAPLNAPVGVDVIPGPWVWSCDQTGCPECHARIDMAIGGVGPSPVKERLGPACMADEAKRAQAGTAFMRMYDPWMAAPPLKLE